MLPNINVRNSKQLTDEELDEFLNLSFDNVQSELESEDSDCEPEVVAYESDVITVENVGPEPGSSAVERGEILDRNMGEDNLYYCTKSNINWNKLPCKATRRRNQNIIKKKPGLNQYSCNISSELEAFQLFLTDEILELIVLYTNQRADQVINSDLLYFIKS